MWVFRSASCTYSADVQTAKDKQVSELEKVAKEHKYDFKVFEDDKVMLKAMKALSKPLSIIVVLNYKGDESSKAFYSITHFNRTTFSIVLDDMTNDLPLPRLQAYTEGANMICKDIESVSEVVGTIHSWSGKASASFNCPHCGFSKLTADDLRTHYFLFHASGEDRRGKCPICQKKTKTNMGVHLHNSHGPENEREPEPSGFPAFSWVVCQDPDTKAFLLTNEPAPICDGVPKYWFPAGRVDPGESFSDAAIRETLEEAGVNVKLVGVLKFMLDDCPRVVFLAHPIGKNAKPKTLPDFESVGAMWVTMDEMAKLKGHHMRSKSPMYYFPLVAYGAEKASMPIDTPEFLALEALMKTLTANANVENHNKFVQAWNQLYRVYPSTGLDDVMRNEEYYGPPPEWSVNPKQEEQQEEDDELKIGPF